MKPVNYNNPQFRTLILALDQVRSPNGGENAEVMGTISRRIRNIQLSAENAAKLLGGRKNLENVEIFIDPTDKKAYFKVQEVLVQEPVLRTTFPFPQLVSSLGGI